MRRYKFTLKAIPVKALHDNTAVWSGKSKLNLSLLFQNKTPKTGVGLGASLDYRKKNISSEELCPQIRSEVVPPIN